MGVALNRRERAGGVIPLSFTNGSDYYKGRHLFYSIAEIYLDSADSSAYLKFLRVSGILVFNDLAVESSCVFFLLSHTV